MRERTAGSQAAQKRKHTQPGSRSDNRKQHRWPGQSGQGQAVSTAEGHMWAQEGRTGLKRHDEETWKQERKNSQDSQIQGNRKAWRAKS